MKKRFLNWLQHIVWRYTEPTAKLANLEARRYVKYVTQHYSELEQVMIIKDLHKELVNHREEQIKNKHVLVLQEKENIEKLETNLEKLKLLYREA
jgi:hypothetical protein